MSLRTTRSETFVRTVVLTVERIDVRGKTVTLVDDKEQRRILRVKDTLTVEFPITVSSVF